MKEIFIGIVLLFVGVLIGRLGDWIPSRAEFKERKKKRKTKVTQIREEIRHERNHFETIKKGEHLGLTGTRRKAVLEYSFGDIKRELSELKTERRYRALVSNAVSIMENRDLEDPRNDIVKLEPLLNKIEEKLEREARR